MGLWDVLVTLWREWTDSVPSVLLVVLLVALLTGWTASGAAIHTAARRRLANAYGWTTWTLVPAVALAAIGIAMPASFHLWALGGLVATPLLALANRALIERAAATCPAGHPIASNWVYCAQCPPPPATGRDRVGAGVGATVAPAAVAPGVAPPPQWRPAGPTLGGFPNGGGAPARPAPSGEVLLRLLPERADLGERVVHKPGGTIGRDPASDIPLDDPGVSWHHARIVERSGSPSVVDLGSSNGTYVNNECVENSMLIDGDRLKVGDVVFRVLRP